MNDKPTKKLKAYRMYHRSMPLLIGVAWAETRSKAKWICAVGYMEAFNCPTKEALLGIVIKRAPEYDHLACEFSNKRICYDEGVVRCVTQGVSIKPEDRG